MLTERQLGYFARNGFLHLENIVPPDICAALVERTWGKLPSRWLRHDPGSWTGRVEDSCHSADIGVRRGHLKFQKGDLLRDPIVTAGFATDSRLGLFARDLIGAPLAPMRVRGLYCITPLSTDQVCAPPPHIEAHPTQLVCLCYLEDVPAGGGGLLVWPGSQREIYPSMTSRLDYAASASHPDIVDRWASLTPHEVPGRRGDVVIIHHRLLHAPSVNRSDRIRFGFLCDYHRHDFRHLSMLPPGGDLWEDWPAMDAVRAEMKDGLSDFVLEPGKRAEVPSLYTWRRRWAFRSRPQPSFPPGTSADYVRKNDASILARSRNAGDIWLQLSDHPATAEERQLYPRGSSWQSTGLRVTLDGQPVHSLCYHDLVSRLSAGPGRHVLAIYGLDREAWLRVLKMRLPLDQPDILLKTRLTAGRSRLHLTVPAGEENVSGTGRRGHPNLNNRPP